MLRWRGYKDTLEMPWPTSWRTSPGRYCSAGNRFTPRWSPWPRRGFIRSERSCTRGLGEGGRTTPRSGDLRGRIRCSRLIGRRCRRPLADGGPYVSLDLANRQRCAHQTDDKARRGHPSRGPLSAPSSDAHVVTCAATSKASANGRHLGRVDEFDQAKAGGEADD